MSNISRVSVFSKVVNENNEFNDKACQALLGDYCDNFISLCDHLKIMQENIESVGLTELKPATHKVLFKVCTKDGTTMEIET